jgi:hypothetical protein
MLDQADDTLIFWVYSYITLIKLGIILVATVKQFHCFCVFYSIETSLDEHEHTQDKISSLLRITHCSI